MVKPSSLRPAAKGVQGEDQMAMHATRASIALSATVLIALTSLGMSPGQAAGLPSGPEPESADEMGPDAQIGTAQVITA